MEYKNEPIELSAGTRLRYLKQLVLFCVCLAEAEIEISDDSANSHQAECTEQLIMNLEDTPICNHHTMYTLDDIVCTGHLLVDTVMIS